MQSSTKMTLYPLVRLGAFRDDPEEKVQVAEKMPNKSVAFENDRGYRSGVSNPITEAARLLGSIKTAKKAKSSRENGKLGAPYGKLGGRPKKNRKKKDGKAA